MEENNRGNRQTSHHQRAEPGETSYAGVYQRRTFAAQKCLRTRTCVLMAGLLRRSGSSEADDSPCMIADARGKVPLLSTMAVMTWCLQATPTLLLKLRSFSFVSGLTRWCKWRGVSQRHAGMRACNSGWMEAWTGCILRPHYLSLNSSETNRLIRNRGGKG